jgi:hypothetical protein
MCVERDFRYADSNCHRILNTESSYCDDNVMIYVTAQVDVASRVFKWQICNRERALV